MRSRIVLAAAVIAIFSVALPLHAAPPEGKGPGNHASSPGNKGSSGKGNGGRLRTNDLFGELAFAGISAAVARDYARDLGLRGYDSLPPGIRKNLARGKPIPPGIAKKMVPGSLLGRLPKHPGYEWRMAGTDLILVSIATAVIADILYDVFD